MSEAGIGLRDLVHIRIHAKTVRKAVARDGTFPADPKKLREHLRALKIEPPPRLDRMFELLLERNIIERVGKDHFRFVEPSGEDDDVV